MSAPDSRQRLLADGRTGCSGLNPVAKRTRVASVGLMMAA
jgi:hypothetical protein